MSTYYINGTSKKSKIIANGFHIISGRSYVVYVGKEHKVYAVDDLIFSTFTEVHDVEYENDDLFSVSVIRLPLVFQYQMVLGHKTSVPHRCVALYDGRVYGISPIGRVFLLKPYTIHIPMQNYAHIYPQPTTTFSLYGVEKRANIKLPNNDVSYLYVRNLDKMPNVMIIVSLAYMGLFGKKIPKCLIRYIIKFIVQICVFG